MSVKLIIPAIFLNVTDNKEIIECSSGNILNIVNELDIKYPGFAEKILDGGKIKKYINIYINNKDVRFLSGENTIVKDNDEVLILPAISDG